MSEPVINCPFYGRHVYAPQPMLRGGYPFVLLNTKGNQCALETDAYKPCLLVIEGRDIDWRECPRVQDIRVL